MSKPILPSKTDSVVYLKRLWSLVKVDRRTLWYGVFFQFWQSISYIPFYAAVSFLERIKQNYSRIV